MHADHIDYPASQIILLLPGMQVRSAPTCCPQPGEARWSSATHRRQSPAARLAALQSAASKRHEGMVHTCGLCCNCQAGLLS